MLAERELSRRTDIMPFSEAQREASEKYTLGWREAVIVKDNESGEEERIRVKNFIQIFASRSDGKYVGNKPLFNGGKPYVCELGEKKIEVRAVGFSEDNKRRVLAFSKVDGVTIVPETDQEN